MAGLSEEESTSQQKGLSSFGARPLPRGRSTVDMSAGYPYYVEGRINVGAGRAGQFAFDAGIGLRSMGSRSEFGIGGRLQLVERDPFSLGAFTDLWWGSALIDDSKRNGITWNAGAIASLTALSNVTISGRAYANVWSDRHCPEVTSSTARDPFDGEAIDTCVGYYSRVINSQTPNDFSDEDRMNVEELTGKKGSTMFSERETGVRLMVAIAAEIALYQRWNIFGMLEIAPFQNERALYTSYFSTLPAKSDPGIYLRLGTSYKF